jgi:hypothetical protein
MDRSWEQLGSRNWSPALGPDTPRPSRGGQLGPELEPRTRGWRQQLAHHGQAGTQLTLGMHWDQC